jgi:hypothetical protein
MPFPPCLELPHRLGVGGRGNSGADDELPMELDARLARAAVGLSPDDRDPGARLGMRRIDDRQRQDVGPVDGVARRGRNADQPITVEDVVGVLEAVAGHRDLQILVRNPLLEKRALDTRHVVLVPHERHLRALLVAGHPLECTLALAPGDAHDVHDPGRTA